MDLADSPSMEDAPAPLAPDALAAARAEIESLRAELARAQQRLAEVELLADRDALTPVLNRRAFVRELTRTLAFCERYDAPASLVFMDMDGLKTINDRFGHAAGDAALHAIAVSLAEHVRESDVIGRLGGDEFGVLLAQAGREAAAAKAADLQRRVEAEPLVFEGKAIPLRVSYGVRTFEPGLEAAQMLAEADAAMYLRKGSRREG
ncbi:MAG TPA: GGDEF domain-containing protein [Caulobacteraceae bacterium]|jgi:diguanylate cyclase (GGDEF)-like protein|nr:GGDEF domain-containing protein [Caulobacteraceae bacterium]